MITQLDTEINAGAGDGSPLNLTSQITVLTHTPNASNPILCQGLIKLGSIDDLLDGSGGNFELTITVGGMTVEPDPQIITFSTATAVAIWTSVFPVPANTEVIFKVKSPNAADTAVDVTTYLFDVGQAVVPDVAGTAATAITSAHSTTDAKIDLVQTLGTGGTSTTYTVLDSESNPIDGVTVWVTTDIEGSNVVASGITNDSGEVVFMLDSGTTYYIWSQKSGYNFTNPDTEEVP